MPAAIHELLALRLIILFLHFPGKVYARSQIPATASMSHYDVHTVSFFLLYHFWDSESVSSDYDNNGTGGMEDGIRETIYGE